MGEFVFRNLSVKVFPRLGDNRSCPDETVTVLACSPCTDLCTGTYRVCDNGCTHEPSVPITVGPYCRGPGTSPGYVDTVTNIILPANDPAGELATLKESLRLAMSVVESAEERMQSDEGYSFAGGIERLRTELLAAADELDEHRRTLE